MTVKSTDEENDLNNNDNLKNSISTSKNLKSKLGFIKSVISTWFSLCIQTQFINLTFTVKLSLSTLFQSRLNILFY